MTGLFSIAETIQRTLPTSTNDVTHEQIHSSVLQQQNPIPQVTQIIEANPDIIAPLSPLEQHVRLSWRVTHAPTESSEEDPGNGTSHSELSQLLHAAKSTLKSGENIGRALFHAATHKESTAAPFSQQDNNAQTSMMQKLLQEHSMGAVFKDILGQK